MAEFTGKLLGAIALQSQDLDLIQRAKEKERIHFVDFTVMDHIRTQVVLILIYLSTRKQ